MFNKTSLNGSLMWQRFDRGVTILDRYDGLVAINKNSFMSNFSYWIYAQSSHENAKPAILTVSKLKWKEKKHSDKLSCMLKWVKFCESPFILSNRNKEISIKMELFILRWLRLVSVSRTNDPTPTPTLLFNFGLKMNLTFLSNYIKKNLDATLPFPQILIVLERWQFNLPTK